MRREAILVCVRCAKPFPIDGTINRGVVSGANFGVGLPRFAQGIGDGVPVGALRAVELVGIPVRAVAITVRTRIIRPLARRPDLLVEIRQHQFDFFNCLPLRERFGNLRRGGRKSHQQVTMHGIEGQRSGFDPIPNRGLTAIGDHIVFQQSRAIDSDRDGPVPVGTEPAQAGHIRLVNNQSFRQCVCAR